MVRPMRNIHSILLVFLTLLAACWVAPATASAQTIISDSFATGFGSFPGTTPATDLPGGTWQTAVGFPDDGGGRQGDHLQTHNGAGYGITLEDNGGYVKPVSFTISCDLNMGYVDSGNPALGLGYFSALDPSGNQFNTTYFTGITLVDASGTTGTSSPYTATLNLYQNGGVQSSITGITGLTLGTYYTLSYTVDTATGNVRDLMFNNTSYTGFDSISGVFTNSNTKYAGVAGFGAVWGAYQDFSVATAVPEPTSLALVCTGLAAAGLLARRRGRA